MRVLMLTHAVPRYDGDGAGEFILRLAVALQARGTEVRILAPAGPGLAPASVIRGVPVHRFRYALPAWETLAYVGTMAEQVRASASGKFALAGMMARGSSALREAIADFGPDLVHAHWWFPLGVAAATSVGDVPMVLTLHGSDVRLASGSPAARAAFRFVAGRARAVTAVSSWLADTAREMAPGLGVTVGPMPVDIAHGKANDVPRGRDVLFVGRINAQKGVADLLRAVSALRSPATLDMVGDGVDRDAMRALATTLGLESRVRWHGHLPQERLPSMYAHAGVVVLPSRDEGLGLVAVEAMLAGTPVVGYRSGGLTDVLGDGAGMLVEPGDVDGLTHAIDRVLSDATLAAKLSARGAHRAAARFTTDAVASAYEAVYAEATR